VLLAVILRCEAAKRPSLEGWLHRRPSRLAVFDRSHLRVTAFNFTEQRQHILVA
jgi:hypothetical protein